MKNEKKGEKKKSHLKLGDKIQVISGMQKGTIGTISSLFLKQSIAYIDSIQPRQKSTKAKNNEPSKTIEIQIPIHISNIMLWDTKLNQPSRIGYQFVGQKKMRYFKKSGNFVENFEKKD
uniref:50S ribosomal protein L24, chloroplastic n=1 Tax=Synura sphagnicola TaxID=52556 RepID=A0A3G2QYT7_9STRA|nr:ribosomal protein L24 [Synura sphagnicola]